MPAFSVSPAFQAKRKEDKGMPWDPLNLWPAGRKWLWLALALFACCLQGPRFLASLRPPPGEGVDFFQEWASARNYFTGLPIYMDMPSAVERYLGYRVDPSAGLTIAHNAHPPTSILLALPFATLDYPDATLAWNLVSLACFAVSLFLVGRELHIPFVAWSVLPLVTLLLLCAPFRQQVNQGQLNLVLLLLLTGTWVLERRGRPAWAGALLGMAMAIKLFPGFLLVYFAVKRQWKALAAAVATFLAVTALTAALLGPGAYRDYIAEVLPSLRQFQGGWNNASLVGLSTKLFAPPAVDMEVLATPPPEPPPGDERNLVTDRMPVFLTRPLWRSQPLAWSCALFLCAGVAILVAWLVHQAQSRPECDHAFGLALIGMLLVSPVAWDHYFLLLLLPLTLCWQQLPPRTWARVSIFAIVIALWLSPFDVWGVFLPLSLIQGRQVWGEASPLHTLTVLSFQLYGLLGLFILETVLLRRLRTTVVAGSHRPSG
jgi:alpha-1,2-mannosyltransferase